MKIKTSKSMIAFQSIACVLLTFGAVICVLPFVIHYYKGRLQHPAKGFYLRGLQDDL